MRKVPLHVLDIVPAILLGTRKCIEHAGTTLPRALRHIWRSIGNASDHE